MEDTPLTQTNENTIQSNKDPTEIPNKPDDLQEQPILDETSQSDIIEDDESYIQPTNNIKEGDCVIIKTSIDNKYSNQTAEIIEYHLDFVNLLLLEGDDQVTEIKLQINPIEKTILPNDYDIIL